MNRFLLLLLLLLLIVGAAPLCSAAGAAAPGNLRCEYLVDPTGIDDREPRFSWELSDPRRGAKQTAYRLLVASDPRLLAAEIGDLWDSGRVEGNQSIHVAYAGTPLRSRARACWKVRAWDANGEPSPWSDPARFSIGLLEPADWRARWIGEPDPPPPAPANNGYHSELADAPDARKWVAVDLGQQRQIDGVRLFPARPYNWTRDAPGFLFPRRFRIEVAAGQDFANAVVVVDCTAADVVRPGVLPVMFEFPAVTGRHVRLFATALAERDPGEHGLALAELQVLAAGRNVALDATVVAADSIEHSGWSSRSLVDDDLESHGPGDAEARPPLLLRRTFTLERPGEVARATAYATALGLYELRINGRRAGAQVLAPEWTDYRRRVQYQTFDLTGLLGEGEQAIGVLLGDGWYAGRIGLAFIVPGGPGRGIYGPRPRFLLQLEIEYANGEVQTIGSDARWKMTGDGPLRSADLLDGETIDARRSVPGFDAPGFDDSGWQPATVCESPLAQLVAQKNEPIRVVREIRPIAVQNPSDGVAIYDMGQNMVGWCRLAVTGEPGDTITLRHAEVLNEDGSLYTKNLRGAAQTDRFILRGGGPERFEPRFTYHGFRYVEVSGLRSAATLDQLTGCVVHSAAPEAGAFECSEPLLNRLWQNILWTQRGNMPSIPTDCPQRDERLGWTGDILAFCQTACFNMDMAAFLAKWLEDMRDAQTADGRFPDFAPHPFDPAARFSGVPAWGDAGVHVAWCHFVNYADRRLLERHYQAARCWVDWILGNNEDLLWVRNRNNDYGDWLNADTLKLEGWPRTGAGVPKEVFATAFFARSTELVAQMAAALDLRAEARAYAKLAADIRAAFQAAYVGADGVILGDTQAGYALALAFDLLPEESRAQAAERMVAGFDRTDGLISTGFHSTIHLMNELTRRGFADEAYRLVLQRRMPSWGYAVDHGATTIWERWDGYVEGRGFQDPGMNSFAHYALGSVGEWMVRTILGINPDPAAPAYRHFFLRPRPGGGLTWAKGSVHTIHGRIESAWRLEDDRLLLDVTVPANTTATLEIEAPAPATISESGGPLAAAAGVRSVTRTDAGLAIELDAGAYRFVIEEVE